MRPECLTYSLTLTGYTNMVMGVMIMQDLMDKKDSCVLFRLVPYTCGSAARRQTPTCSVPGRLRLGT